MIRNVCLLIVVFVLSGCSFRTGLFIRNFSNEKVKLKIVKTSNLNRQYFKELTSISQADSLVDKIDSETIDDPIFRILSEINLEITEIEIELPPKSTTVIVDRKSIQSLSFGEKTNGAFFLEISDDKITKVQKKGDRTASFYPVYFDLYSGIDGFRVE